MNAGARLALYGAGLLVAFGGAYGLARVAVPESVVAAWAEGSGTMEDHGEHGASAPDGRSAPVQAEGARGLSLSEGGYALSPVEAPRAVGEAGELSFRIDDATGEPLTEYATTHERRMHLIVVRSDGSDFRHAHAELDAGTGTWSLPWTWSEAGTYRVYADFAPANGAPLTLSRTVDVAGDFSPATPEPSRTAEVDGYIVRLRGELVAGSASELTLSVERNGRPVTALQPYLGAFGHLVALRQGDLAFLHVHPEGEEPGEGDLGGPRIAFAAEAPTAGRYLLYLDFRVDGRVRTAAFVLDARSGGVDASSGAGHTTHTESE